MTKKLFVLTLTLLLLVACTSKREEEFAQGVGQQDLWSVKSVQDQYFTIQTHGTLIEKIESNADELKLGQGDENYEHLTNFNVVNYATNCPLLKDVPLYARENSSYQARYVLNKHYLVVMLVAPKEMLRSQDRITAKQIPGTDLWEIPLIGYPITLKKVERIEDANGDETSKLNEYAAAELEEASHFKIDITNRTLFDKLEKHDIFPREYFEGEWYYAATVVSANSEQSDLIGRDLSEDSEQAYVSRIKFIESENSLIGMNVNMDENIDNSDEINANVAIEVPVKWVDYSMEDIGKDAGLNEVINDGTTSPTYRSKPWKQRKYAKADFAYTKAGFSMNAYNEVLNPKFQNLEINTSYFSFTIYYPDAGVRVKFAFKRAPAVPKPGRVYYKEDRTVFGFFLTNKQFISNHRFYYRDDFDKQVLLNRFYPEVREDGRKVIEYRFTHTTPKEFRSAAKEVVEQWNKIFEKAETGIEIIINDDPGADVDLGDLRYNIMNIVDTKDGASLLGYGPSIADTKSGEIVSATTNVYINPFRDGIVSNLRKYIRYRLGMFDAEYLNASNLDSHNPDVATMYDFYQKIEASDLPENAKEMLELNKTFFLENNRDEVVSYKAHQERVRQNQTKRNFHEQRFGQKCNYQAHSHDLIARIERDCKEDFLPYVEELVEMGVTHDERELDILQSCANKLIHEELVATLVHEMGHNFGLRHNFSASNDPENFYDPNETNGVLVKTSSTMDYNNGQSYELMKPGPYDLAAIRFGYSNSVETEDGDVVELNTQKTIAENIVEKKITPRRFNYCTDEHVGDKDPLCVRWDYGQNPSEVVDSVIAYYKSLYATYGYRYDKAYGPLQAQFDNIVTERVILPLKQIYEHWRFLLKERIGDQKMHLEMYSVEEFENLLNEMKNDPGKDGRNYKLYYEASNKAYEFLKSLVKTTARYCVLQENGVEQLRYADFETTREEVYSKTGVTIFDCADPAALALFANQGAELVRTVGSYYNGVTQSLDPYHETETYNVGGTPQELLEITGTANTRMLGMVALALRQPTLRHGAKVGNTANFLDDPRYRREMIGHLANQALYGTTTADLGTGDLEQRRVALFKRDQGVRVNSFMQLLTGMAVPGNATETLARWSVFKPLMTSISMASSIPATAVKAQVDSTVYYATSDRALAYAMIARLNELMSMDATLKQIQPEAMTIPTSEQVMEQISKLPLIPLAMLNSMNLGELREALFTIRDIVEGLQDPNQKIIAKDILAQEFSIISILVQYEEEINKMLDARAVEVLIGQMGLTPESIVCYAEATQSRVDQWVVTQEQYKAGLVDFRSNQMEYHAQIDMLRAILSTMAKAN